MACGQTSSPPSHDERQIDSERIDVMFLCDEWKSSKGGLSTFNREFAVNLAKTTGDSIKVHCYVSQSDEQSRVDAKQHGVNLITAESIPGSVDPLDWLKIPPPELPNPDIVVGHGRKFGTPAYFIVRAAKCRWIHFVHVFCEDLGRFKATQSAAVDTIEENEKKHKREIELCKAADVVVAVGSRLQQKYSRSLPNIKVEIITPGILEKFSDESSQLVKDRSVVKNFNVFMFGRVSFEDLTLKGYDIVANAIGSLGRMFELTIVGSSPGEHRIIQQWFVENTHISQNQLTIRSYCDDQDELKMMFHESDMIALPSRTEGFGLVGLEAISAGIPVLVGGESGIAEALHKVEGGKSVIVESNDTEEWAQRIKQLSSQSPGERQNSAKLLRDNYNKIYPWNSECERFKRLIQDLVDGLNALKVRIDVESMKPAECNTENRTPISAIESGGSQNGGHQEAYAVPVPSGHTQPSFTGIEVLQVRNHIPTKEEVLSLIATNYLLTRRPRSEDDHDNFLTYMEKMGGIIAGVGTGSLLITVRCDSLQILERLWEDYSSGHLSEVVQRCFVTEEILTELSLAELKLTTTISKEEYKACKMYFAKDPAQDRHENVAVPVEKRIHFAVEEMLAQPDDEDDSVSVDEGSKLSDVLKRHPDFLDQLALCLDRDMRLIPNWKQLARELNVDEDVVKRLELYKDQSPTIRLFEYLEVTQPQLTIQQLRNAMLDIRRNDLFSLLTTKGGFPGSDRVQEVMTSQPPSPSASLLDEIALALDSKSLVLANWYQLAIKLGVPRKDCWKFERHSTHSPTNELFQYLEATRPQMTLKKLKETLRLMKRNDLLDFLNNQSLEDGVSLKDVMTPGSELLQTVTDKLNREIPGVEDWRHLACKLDVPIDMRQAFGGSGQKRKSPTKEVMQWLVARFPDTTLKDVVKALDKIQRNDAIQIITRQFPDSVDSSLHRLDSSLHEGESIDLPINDPTGETLSTRYKREKCGSFKGKQGKKSRCNPLTCTNEGEFNAFLVNIADEITKEEVQQMKFLCLGQNNNLPRGPLEQIEEPREFVNFLRRRGQISPEDVGYLIWLLDTSGNKRLAKMIKERVTPGSPSSPGPGKPGILPCLTTHFTGRKEDVEKIITKLRTDALRMIVIVSPPGMGKTEVAISVSHSLKNREPALSVIYVDRLDKLTDICGEILDRLSSRTWSTSVDLISQAKRKLSELQEDTVIVLDNTEDVQGKEFDDLAEWLVKSAPRAQLIITTCQDVGFVSADIHKVQLKPLDANLSAELLRKLDVNCSEEQVKDLGELCGGIPLLLISCACLLKEGFNPEVLIQELRNNPIRLLKSNATEVYDALGRFVKKFSKDLIANLVFLSVFPKTFSPEDITFLFEFKDQLQLETVKTKMVKCTLLQKVNDQKLSLHPLLQAFCRTERVSLNMVDVGCNAQRKFNCHYLELLKSLSKKFISKNSALVAVQTWRDQKVNIIAALKNCFEDTNGTDQKGLAIDVVNSTEVLDFLAKVLSPPKECAEFFRKCCDITKTSGDKRRHAESLNSLGFRRLVDVAHSNDEPEGSRVTLQLFQEAHDIRKTLPEEDQKCQTHAHTISKLGLCHVLQGDEEKGRALIKEGIKMREELGVSLYLAAGNCDLGNSYRLCGDHQTAIDIWKINTLPVYMEELGDHPWTASILNFIAGSYKVLATERSEHGYAEQAEMYFRQALELRRRLLGFHQDTARSHVSLSDVLVILGNSQSALDELQKALEIQKDVLGPQHKNTTDTLNKITDLVTKMGCKDKGNARKLKT